MARRNGGQRAASGSGIVNRSQKLSQTLPSFGGGAFEFKAKQPTREWIPPPQWKAAATSAGWVGAADDTLGSTFDGTACMSKTYSDPGLLPKIEGQRASSAEESTEAKSPTVVLKRENNQLRRELEQMEVSLLESFRRGDRFMSGGKCASNNQPVMKAYLRDKDELRRARERGSQLEDELRRAVARVEALEIERDLQGEAHTGLGELNSQAKAFAEDNELLRKVAAAESERAREFEEIAQRAEQAERWAQEEAAASYQASGELTAQLNKERAEWAEAQSWMRRSASTASTQTCQEPADEKVLVSPPPTSAKDMATLQSWVARWAGDDPNVILGLCLHAWYREASLELRRRAAALANHLESERDSTMRARDKACAQLEEERGQLEASLKDKQALERDKQRLMAEGNEAKEMCKGFQKDMDRLWQKSNAAELALTRERKELERVREESFQKRRDGQQALDAAELRLKKAEMAFENAQKHEADLKAQMERLALAAEQKEPQCKLRDMEKELKIKCEEVVEIRAENEKCKNQRRRSEERLQKLQTEYDELQRDYAQLSEERDALQQTAAKEQLRQMFRLQVLAPSVTVSLAHMKAMDMKAAPSEGQIRKVMMERVLPQFAKVLLHDDTKDLTPPTAQTSQLVQSVVTGMVSSIEDKLQSLLGTSCVRISMKT